MYMRQNKSVIPSNKDVLNVISWSTLIKFNSIQKLILNAVVPHLRSPGPQHTMCGGVIRWSSLDYVGNTTYIPDHGGRLKRWRGELT